MNPLGVRQVAFARPMGVPIQRVNEIVRGKQGITPETACLVAQVLGTTAEFWANLQNAYDLSQSHPTRKVARLKVTQ